MNRIYVNLSDFVIICCHMLNKLPLVSHVKQPNMVIYVFVAAVNLH